MAIFKPCASESKGAPVRAPCEGTLSGHFLAKVFCTRLGGAPLRVLLKPQGGLSLFVVMILIKKAF